MPKSMVRWEKKKLRAYKPNHYNPDFYLTRNQQFLREYALKKRRLPRRPVKIGYEKVIRIIDWYCHSCNKCFLRDGFFGGRGR